MHRSRPITAGLWASALLIGAAGGVLAGEGNLRGEGGEGLGLGRTATETEIRAWDIDVSPTGAGLPPGKGTAKEGARIYGVKCSACHGMTGTEGPAPPLVGGKGTLTKQNPIKTVGSYWPYATTLYDYIRRAMPFPAPQSLTADELYAVVAWILAQNGIIPDDRILDAASLPQITMPNRDGFVPDPRPDVPQ